MAKAGVEREEAEARMVEEAAARASRAKTEEREKAMADEEARRAEERRAKAAAASGTHPPHCPLQSGDLCRCGRLPLLLPPPLAANAGALWLMRADAGALSLMLVLSG